MRNILKRKPVIVGLIALVVIAIVAPVAIVSAAPTSSPQLSRPGSNFTSVQGVISSITSTGIVITTTASNGTTSQVSLAINENTNFNIHGIDWLSGSLNGETVSAMYKNNQTVTPPVASQITINMPKPTAPATSVFKNGAVQGTIASINSNTMTITLNAAGAGTLAANQKVVIVPSPVQATPNKNVAREQGTVASISGNTLTVTLTGTGTNTLTVGQAVNIMPNPMQGTANKIFAREQGTVATISGNTVTITLTGTSTGNLAANQKVFIVPSPVQGTQNKSVTREQGTIASISGNTVTVTLTGTGTVTLTVGQTVSIGPGMTPGVARPQNNNNGRFGGFTSRF
jgi:hypothetical protein